MIPSFWQNVKRGLKEILHLNFDYVLNAMAWRTPLWLFKYDHSVIVKSDNPKFIIRKLTSYFQRFATLEDSDLLYDIGISKELFKERLEHNDRCYIMGQDGEVLTVIWGSSGKRYINPCGTILDPGNDGFMLYGGFTKESARLRGMFPVVFNEIYQSYVKENKTCVYASISTLNVNSLRIHKRMNFKIVGEAVYFSIFSLKFTYYKYWPHKTNIISIFIKTPPDNLFWN